MDEEVGLTFEDVKLAIRILEHFVSIVRQVDDVLVRLRSVVGDITGYTGSESDFAKWLLSNLMKGKTQIEGVEVEGGGLTPEELEKLRKLKDKVK